MRQGINNGGQPGKTLLPHHDSLAVEPPLARQRGARWRRPPVTKAPAAPLLSFIGSPEFINSLDIEQFIP